jgi:hypothetical protein
MAFICYDEIIWVEPDGKTPPKISIGFPRQHPKGDYACHVVVDGLSIRVDKEQFGVTKSQAICLALRLVTQTILGCAEFASGQLMVSLSDGTTEPLTGEMIGAGVFQKAEW